MNTGSFSVSDLHLVHDRTPVEHLGGPQDGELRPVSENGCRMNGMYVVVNNAHDVVVAKRYVPTGGL